MPHGAARERHPRLWTRAVRHLEVSAAPPQWPGTDGLLGHIVRLDIAVQRVLESIAARSDISVADYLVLGVVRRSPDHRSAPSVLCEVLGRTSGGMSLALDRLERAGLVRRLPDPSDRRRVIIEATADGLALARRVNADLHDWEESLGVTGSEQSELVSALGRLTEMIGTADAPVARAG
ncbi:MAG: winged helix-turn-helix transcriptional regulator [Acidimicrobiia bacterium]|nr:winged helix-turn-helix transcriptional regulator [Acidimicrobiia bacterium]